MKLMIHVEGGASESEKARIDVELDSGINEKHVGNVLAEVTRAAALAIVRARGKLDHEAMMASLVIAETYRKSLSANVITVNTPLVAKRKKGR